MKTNFLKKNISILIPIFLLLVISLLNLYGAKYINPIYNNSFNRQIIWIIVGLITSVFIYKLDCKWLIKKSGYSYIIGIILLFLVLIIGKNVNGSKAWFRIIGISIQPSEIFKFFFILYLAKTISGHKSNDIFLIIKLLFLTLIPCILIFLEPDTGIVILYILIFIGELFASKISKYYKIGFIIINIVLIISVFLIYSKQQDIFIKLFGNSIFYRIDRLITFKNNSSYQLNNALIGVGSSGLFGHGITNPKLYVPEITTDFIFDLTIMNFGYLIGIIVVLIYCYLIYDLIKLTLKTDKYYYKCVLCGILPMFVFQIIEHICMNLGLTPITGITLPFLSYGGSSLFGYFMIYTFILKIKKEN